MTGTFVSYKRWSVALFLILSAVLGVVGMIAPAYAACSNPAPLPTSFAAPCPVWSPSASSVPQSGTLTLTASPQPGTDYILTTAYISQGTAWNPYTLLGNNAVPNYSSSAASLTLSSAQLSSLSLGTHYAVVWDWLWDSTAQCYKGPGLNQCNTGTWRVQSFTVTASYAYSQSTYYVYSQSAYVTASLTVSPSTLNFGNQPVGIQSASQSSILKNVSTVAVTWAGGTMTGSADFLYIGDNCGTGLAAGASCTLNYAFKPSVAAIETGANVISFSGGTGGPVTVNLTGKGINPIPAYYGPGIGADSLNNHQVADNDVDNRFRAATTSALNSLISYNIAVIHSCPPISGGTYGCGTGGTMHICIQTDDGTASHHTTGTNLACTDDVQPITNNAPKLRTETFSSPASLTAGVLYHIHWHNTDPNPTSNFVSVDDEYTFDATVPRQPTISDTDLEVRSGQNGPDTVATHDTPLFQLTYANGVKQGQGYMENWFSNAPLISGAQTVREQFTVSGGDRVVSSVSLHMKRDSSNTGSGPLTVRLETGAGALIEQGTIPANTFPVGTRDASAYHAGWGTYTFTTPRTLTNGQSYHLVLSAPSDTVFCMQAMERGNNYGFVVPTFFGDGYGQYSINSGSTWSGFDQMGGGTNFTNADMQFYFTL